VPDADLELRRLRLRNRSRRRRRLEVTTYAEVVLNDPAAHAAHPAFSKLFVQTEYVPDPGALLARRRPRSPEERVAWMVHTLAGHCASPAAVDVALARAADAERALLARLRLSEDQGELFQEIAGAILYGLPADKRIADRARDYWRAKGLDLVPRKGASPSRPR